MCHPCARCFKRPTVGTIKAPHFLCLGCTKLGQSADPEYEAVVKTHHKLCADCLDYRPKGETTCAICPSLAPTPSAAISAPVSAVPGLDTRRAVTMNRFQGTGSSTVAQNTRVAAESGLHAGSQSLFREEEPDYAAALNAERHAASPPVPAPFAFDTPPTPPGAENGLISISFTSSLAAGTRHISKADWGFAMTCSASTQMGALRTHASSRLHERLVDILPEHRWQHFNTDGNEIILRVHTSRKNDGLSFISRNDNNLTLKEWLAKPEGRASRHFNPGKGKGADKRLEKLEAQQAFTVGLAIQLDLREYAAHAVSSGLEGDAYVDAAVELVEGIASSVELSLPKGYIDKLPSLFGRRASGTQVSLEGSSTMPSSSSSTRLRRREPTMPLGTAAILRANNTTIAAPASLESLILSTRESLPRSSREISKIKSSSLTLIGDDVMDKVIAELPPHWRVAHLQVSRFNTREPETPWHLLHSGTARALFDPNKELGKGDFKTAYKGHLPQLDVFNLPDFNKIKPTERVVCLKFFHGLPPPEPGLPPEPEFNEGHFCKIMRKGYDPPRGKGTWEDPRELPTGPRYMTDPTKLLDNDYTEALDHDLAHVEGGCRVAQLEEARFEVRRMTLARDVIQTVSKIWLDCAHQGGPDLLRQGLLCVLPCFLFEDLGTVDRELYQRGIHYKHEGGGRSINGSLELDETTPVCGIVEVVLPSTTFHRVTDAGHVHKFPPGHHLHEVQALVEAASHFGLHHVGILFSDWQAAMERRQVDHRGIQQDVKMCYLTDILESTITRSAGRFDQGMDAINAFAVRHQCGEACSALGLPDVRTSIDAARRHDLASRNVAIGGVTGGPDEPLAGAAPSAFGGAPGSGVPLGTMNALFPGLQIEGVNAGSADNDMLASYLNLSDLDDGKDEEDGGTPPPAGGDNASYTPRAGDSDSSSESGADNDDHPSPPKKKNKSVGATSGGSRRARGGSQGTGAPKRKKKAVEEPAEVLNGPRARKPTQKARDNKGL